MLGVYLDALEQAEQAGQSSKSLCRKRQIAQYIHRKRGARPSALVGKCMLVRGLRDGWTKQSQCQQTEQSC